MLNAFKTCDEVLLQGVQGITDLITTPGLINTDFADVRMIMSNAGSALMGIGYASGDGRAVNAARAAISSPMLEASVEGARGMLLNVSGPSDLGLFEVNEAAEIVAKAAHPDANIIFGAVIDDGLGDEVRITVIAAGFDRYEGESVRPRGLDVARARRRRLDLGDGIDFSVGAATTTPTATTSSTCPSSCADRAPFADRACPFPAPGSSSPTGTAASPAAPYATPQPRGPRRRRSRRGRREPDARRAARRPGCPADPRGVGVAAPGARRATSSSVDAPPAAPPDADAAVTTRVGLPLVVLTADCAPVALVAPGAVAVVHAGWPGLEQGVLGAAVDALRARAADGPIRAVLGPCVHPARYEFGADLLDRLVDRLGPEVAARTDDRAARARHPRRGPRRARAAPGSTTSTTSTCAPPRRPTTSPTGATASPVARRWSWCATP